MTSILTNSSAMAASQGLQAASDEMQSLQTRVATGLKVGVPKDNSAVFAIAQKMRSDLSGWQAADDSLARGVSLLDVAAAGTARISDLLNQLKQRAVAYTDPSLDPAGRDLVQADIRAIVDQIDKTALNAEINGLKPLADTLIPSSSTTSVTTYAVTSSTLTPPGLAGPMESATGGGSQTLLRDGGPVGGRFDVFLDAYGVPDVLEIWQGGVRVAATGQPYAAGGGPVGPGAPVSGQTALSFDYNPAAGQNLEFRFNENLPAAGSMWTVGGVVLQPPADPLPSGVTANVTTNGMTSAPTTYSFIRGADMSHEDVAAQALTAAALGLGAVDWNDPGAVLGLINQAIVTANAAAAYFGERQAAFEQILAQNSKVQMTMKANLGGLVDTDMGKDAAKLQAAQAQQQLAAQTVSVANAGPQWILTLFKLG